MPTEQAGDVKYLITSSHFTALKMALSLRERENEKCKFERLLRRG